MASIGELVSEGVARLGSATSEAGPTDAGSSPRLDAELLLAFALGIDRTGILAHPEAPVGDSAAETYRALVERRAAGEPVAYLRGIREFHGLAFAVDPRALIPRPETELLVELAEHAIVDRLTSGARPPGTAPIRVADVGTGSGAIAVALAAALRRRRMADEVELVAIDVSPDALAVAMENAVGHGVADHLEFVVADLLQAERGRPFDVLAANLPYVAPADLDRSPALAHEPRVALDGGPDGLDVVRRLLPQLPAALATDGVALLEIGAAQGAAVRAAVDDALPGWRCEVLPDLAGRDRVVRLAPPAEPGVVVMGSGA